MRNSILLTSCFLMVCIAGAPASAQNESDIDDVMEKIEALADELGGNAEEMGAAIEDMLGGHVEELEEWAERYSKDWERWAEKFEKRFESWAKNHEKEWEDWAESYSGKWERWAEAMDRGEWDPEQIGQLVQKNLEMLGDMPLGDLVEGMVEKGVKGMEDAPWESLQDLQFMLQDSIKQSVAETERRFAGEKEKYNFWRQKNKSIRRDVDKDAEYILPVIENQQENLQRKEKALSDMAEDLMAALKEKVNSGDLEDDNIESLLKMVAKQKSQRKELRKQQQALEIQKQQIRRFEKENKTAALVKQDLEARRKQVEQARREAEKRLSRSLEQVKERETLEEPDRLNIDKKRLERLLKAFEAEERKLKRKNDELEQLRNEVRQLREELKAMAKYKADKLK